MKSNVRSVGYSGPVFANGCQQRADSTCEIEKKFYVYFPPTTNGRMLRYGPTNGNLPGLFTDPGSWSSFDVSVVVTTALKPRASALPPSGFAGGVFDGRFVYFPAASSGDSRVLRCVNLEFLSTWIIIICLSFFSILSTMRFSTTEKLPRV